MPMTRRPRRRPLRFWGMIIDLGSTLRTRAMRCWNAAAFGRLPVPIPLEARLQHQLRRTAVELERRDR